jgi:hypothetical protein
MSLRCRHILGSVQPRIREQSSRHDGKASALKTNEHECDSKRAHSLEAFIYSGSPSTPAEKDSLERSSGAKTLTKRYKQLKLKPGQKRGHPAPTRDESIRGEGNDPHHQSIGFGACCL